MMIQKNMTMMPMIITSVQMRFTDSAAKNGMRREKARLESRRSEWTMWPSKPVRTAEGEEKKIQKMASLATNILPRASSCTPTPTGRKQRVDMVARQSSRGE